MSSEIAAAKVECVTIAMELQSEYKQFQFQFGAVFYRDPIDSPSDTHQTFMLKDQIKDLETEIGTVRANGGGDGPEDWVGAYRLALDGVGWRTGHRLIIHIADAAAHTAEYCGSTNHEEERGKLEPLIRECARRGIKIVGMPIGTQALGSFRKCEEQYKAAKGLLYAIHSVQPHDRQNLEVVRRTFKAEVMNTIASICAAAVTSR
jgi:hypothetical protein